MCARKNKAEDASPAVVNARAQANAMASLAYLERDCETFLTQAAKAMHMYKLRRDERAGHPTWVQLRRAGGVGDEEVADFLKGSDNKLPIALENFLDSKCLLHEVLGSTSAWTEGERGALALLLRVGKTGERRTSSISRYSQ